MQHSGRYFKQDTIDAEPLENVASMKYKKHDMDDTRPNRMRDIYSRREKITQEVPVLKERVLSSLAVISGTYIIAKSAFNFSPGMSMGFAGITGFVVYKGNYHNILRRTYESLNVF